MKCIILHEMENRIRVHLDSGEMTLFEADVLEYYLLSMPGIEKVKVFDRTGDVAVIYKGERRHVTDALARFSFDDEDAIALVPEHTGRALRREYADRLTITVMKRLIGRFLMPAPLRMFVTIIRSIPYFKRGLDCLVRRKLEVPVLDAVAIAAGMIRGDFNTSASVMFLLTIGEILEEWTHKKSVDDLVRSMSLNVEKVWKVDEEGREELVDIDTAGVGDHIVVRMGHMIPLDGKVVAGECAVNQASMTGESLPVHKKPGSYVYTGTVVEEGQCTIEVAKSMGEGRYDRIVTMIEESEKLKSSTEAKTSHLADRLVPYHLGVTLLTLLITRNPAKAMSILMVDFCCALKLSIPVAVLSAMRDCSAIGMTVKGGKAMEKVADADTIVFDKTGTLTCATPTVAKVVTFDGKDEDEMLRVAACLEEHYPHSVATAVVEEAERRNLIHEERHNKVDYVVAHGIASTMDGEKVNIGSYHYIFEDEGCTCSEADMKVVQDLEEEYSYLFLAIAGKLAAVIAITDPLRPEAPEVIAKLHKMGISKIVMMTGDNAKTARAIARSVGVDEFYAEVLPEHKASFIKKEHRKGRKVMMVGDGVNDTPALSEADVGIAISEGASIAREVADITISADDLYGLIGLRNACTALMKRIDRTYKFIMVFNTSLIGAGLMGSLSPSTAALFHNLSTLAIGTHNMLPLPHEE